VVNPAAVLSDQLAAARRRGEGFTSAWPAALETALAAADHPNVWRAAFERRPASNPERAIGQLAEPAALTA
jgi:hypothetical protein